MEEEKDVVPCDCTCIHKLGYVEIVNADGSMSQVKTAIGKQMVENLEKIKSAMGGNNEG